MSQHDRDAEKYLILRNIINKFVFYLAETNE